MGLAENSLMVDVQKDYFNSVFKVTDIDFTYGTDLSGSIRVHKALCDFVNDPEGVFKPLVPLQPKHIICGAGVTALLDMLAFHVADEGDGILLAAPYYAGFNGDLKLRNSVQAIPVFVPRKDWFTPTGLETFEETYEAYTAKGVKIRAVILCNPHNPIGQCYSRETILSYARFCERHNLHLISDEVYAYSVFPTSDDRHPEPFVSAFSIDFRKEADCDPGRVHILYGSSKDFNFNGLRAAALFSQHNPEFVNTLKSTSFFMKISSPSLILWASVLENRAYWKAFQQENVKRLREAYQFVTGWLKFHDIPYIPSNAGHFLMADFRRFFTNHDMEGNVLKPVDEDGGAERDMALCKQFFRDKVFLGTSKAFSYETPGWFRITFATRKDFLVVALARLEKALGIERWPSLTEAKPFGDGFDISTKAKEVSKAEQS